MEAEFTSQIILKAVEDNKIVGTVRAYVKDGTCYIGRLAVEPTMQGRGIGKALMGAIEKACPAKRYELFTGTKSEKNIALYKKLGYTIYKQNNYGCGGIDVYYFEKLSQSK